MADVLLSTHGLLKRFGGLVATNLLELDIIEGEIHAVIGPNGAGKTTLVAQLAGDLAPDAGSIRFAGRDITRDPPARRAARARRSFQVTTVFPEFSAWTTLRSRCRPAAGHSFRFWRAGAARPALREPARRGWPRWGWPSALTSPPHPVTWREARAGAGDGAGHTAALVLLDEPMAGMGPRTPRAWWSCSRG